MAMVNLVSPKKKGEPGKAGIDGKAPASQAEGPAPPPRLYLEHDHLKKLGITEMPAVGTKLHFHAVGHVGSTNEDQDRGDGEARHSMTLHIHQMDMGDGKQPEMSDEDQKAGAKAEIDKALAKAAGSEKSKAKAPGAKEGGKGG